MVWPQIAEISLLGALGCGRWLIDLLLDELEAEGSPYLYVVTQAWPQHLVPTTHHTPHTTYCPLPSRSISLHLRVATQSVLSTT